MRTKIPSDVLETCVAEYDGQTNTVPVLATKYGLNKEALYQALWRRKISHRPSATYFTRRYKDWFYNAKTRAKKLGLAWDLSFEDVVVPETCPLLGIPIRFSTRKEDSIDHSPSIDRLDNTKGYTKDNVWVISWRANKIKNDATISELKLLTANLERKLRGNT